MDYNLSGFTINNFRVFNKETHFNITPLTILTGTNSSGKSSFTKALHLLSKSYKSNGLHNLELMESDLKIGSFKAIKNSFNNRNEISFALEIEMSDFFTDSRDLHIYKIELVYGEEGLKGLKVFNQSELVLERVGDFSKSFPIFKKSFIKLPAEIINKEALKKLFKNLSQKDFEKIYDDILYYLQTNVAAHTYKEAYYDEDIQLNNYDQIEESFTRIIDGLTNLGKVEVRKRSSFDEETSQEIEYEEEIIYSSNPCLKDILSASTLEITSLSNSDEYLSTFLNLEIFKEFEVIPNKILKNFFNRLEFIDGVRATQEIIYTKENSPVFYKVLANVLSKQSSAFRDLQRWLVDEFKLIQLDKGQKIEDVIQVKQITGYGYMVKIMKNGQDIGLNGLGYGVAQLLPILIKVILSPKSIFIIEEPESNLHPALQSKLADFFTRAIHRNGFLTASRFIIETHSEYMIRKLQYLTAKGESKTHQVQIYYFNHSDKEEGEEQVKKININNDGSLTDNFGSGFFDEATSWKFELLKLNNSQKN